jgi:hypothetical protein
VTIADPLTIPQAQLIEAGLKQPEGHEDEERIWLSVIDTARRDCLCGEMGTGGLHARPLPRLPAW